MGIMRPAMIVTGGARGIGAATAVAAAGRGYDVAVAYLSRTDEADRVVAECRRLGARALAVRADVSVPEEVDRLFATVDSELDALSVLVNNAGITAPGRRVEDLDPDRIERILRVNVLSVLMCSRAAVRRMGTEHGGSGGAIVNVSSRAAVLGGAGEYVDYAAAKAAVDTITVGLAKEVAGQGIRVNGVRPGLIHTAIHAITGDPDRVDKLSATVPLLRGGQPDEVAAAILWLASAEASYVTGALLDVSGGR